MVQKKISLFINEVYHNEQLQAVESWRPTPCADYSGEYSKEGKFARNATWASVRINVV